MYKWNPFILGGEAPGSFRFIAFTNLLGKKTKQEPVREEMWSPEQKEVFAQIWPQVKTGLTQPVPTYPKSMYAPKTVEEAAYLGDTEALAEYLGEVRGRLGKPAYEVTPETTEQFFQQAIRAPAVKEWQETVEPLIREAYAGPGYWGSARAGAQAKGAETLATTLGAQRAELYYKDEEARRAALTEAATREATFGAGVSTAEAEITGAAGAYSRMIEQEKIVADYQRWLTGEEVEGVTPTQYNPYLQLAFQLLGLDPYALGTKTTSSGLDLNAVLSAASIAAAA